MISLYKEAIDHSGLPSEEYFEYINSLVPEMFLPLLEEFTISAKSVLLYVLHGYSIESKLLLLKSNWSVNKKMIAEKVDIPMGIWENVVLLKSGTLRNVIRAYLDYQCDFDFKHLKLQEDIYEAMMSDVYNKMYDENGNLNSGIVEDSRKAIKALQVEISELKDILQERYKVYYENIEELEKDKSSGEKAVTMNMVTSRFVKK